MAGQNQGPLAWPPSVAVLVVALFGFAYANQTAGISSPPQTAPSVETARTEAPRPAPESPAASDWAANSWGAADLFRRFLGDVPKRERAPAPVAVDKTYLTTLKARVLARARVDTLVVTIADYHDSHTRWRADEVLNAIQAATGQRQFVLFDFYLPDWRPESTDSRTRTARDHEREPGALLFQNSGGDRPTLLLVLLVPETPTAGVHGAVMQTAIRFAHYWSGTHLRIVGPMSSGSIPSIRMALENTACALAAGKAGNAKRPALHAHVVSGMATSQTNKTDLESVMPPCDQARPKAEGGALKVDFQTTVHVDGDLLRVMHDQLQRIDRRWARGEHVALLVESNTGWGANLAPSDASGAASRESCADGTPATGIAFLPCAKQLPFPLHVSRLSRVGDNDNRTVAPTLPSWASPLLSRGPAVADTITPTDALPTFTPNTTATIVGAMLHDTLETLARGDFGAVGILATDIRDHLFLAREITKIAPGLLMFGTEPHLLMLHPEFQPYVRGTLMASSYPMHAHTQRLTSDAAGMQFASMGAQGTFNAVLSQLIALDPSSGPERKALVDYRAPRISGAPAAAGPVPWVVVVGRDAFLPIVAGEAHETPPGSLVSSAAAAPVGTDDYLLSSWQLRLLLAGAGVLLAAHLISLALAQVVAVPGHRFFSPPSRCSGTQRSEHRLLTLACASAVALCLAWQLRLWQTLTQASSPASPVVAAVRILFIACVFVAATAALQTGVTAIRRVFEAWRTESVQAELTSLVPTALAQAMATAVLLYLTDREIWFGSTAVFHVERTLALTTFTSPAPVILALLGLVYGWSFWGIRSLHRHVVDGSRTTPLHILLRGGRHGLASDLTLGARSTIHPMGRFMRVLVPLAPLVMLLGLPPRTHAVEGEHFAWVLGLGSVLGILALGIELGQATWLGSRVKESLEYLRGHALGPSIERLALEPVEWRIAVEPGEGNTGVLIAQRVDALHRRLDSMEKELKHALPVLAPRRADDRRDEPGDSSVPGQWEEVVGARASIRATDVHSLSTALRGRDDPFSCPTPMFRTHGWTTAVTVANALAAPMERRFWRQRRQFPTDTGMKDFLEDGERFVALVTAVLVKTLAVRVVRGLSIAAIMGGTLMMAHLFYTFPGRQFWLFVDFIALSVVALVSVRQLLVLERDYLLSKLWSSTPGRVDLASGLVWRGVAATALPLVTLLAALFPEIGGRYLAWVEPLRQLMPVP